MNNADFGSKFIPVSTFKTNYPSYSSMLSSNFNRVLPISSSDSKDPKFIAEDNSGKFSMISSKDEASGSQTTDPTAPGFTGTVPQGQMIYCPAYGPGSCASSAEGAAFSGAEALNQSAGSFVCTVRTLNLFNCDGKRDSDQSAIDIGVAKVAAGKDATAVNGLINNDGTGNPPSDPSGLGDGSLKSSPVPILTPISDSDLDPAFLASLNDPVPQPLLAPMVDAMQEKAFSSGDGMRGSGLDYQPVDPSSLQNVPGASGVNQAQLLLSLAQIIANSAQPSVAPAAATSVPYVDPSSGSDMSSSAPLAAASAGGGGSGGTSGGMTYLAPAPEAETESKRDGVTCGLPWSPPCRIYKGKSDNASADTLAAQGADAQQKSRTIFSTLLLAEQQAAGLNLPSVACPFTTANLLGKTVDISVFCTITEKYRSTIKSLSTFAAASVSLVIILSA